MCICPHTRARTHARTHKKSLVAAEVCTTRTAPVAFAKITLMCPERFLRLRLLSVRRPPQSVYSVGVTLPTYPSPKYIRAHFSLRCCNASEAALSACASTDRRVWRSANVNCLFTTRAYSSYCVARVVFVIDQGRVYFGTCFFFI